MKLAKNLGLLFFCFALSFTGLSQAQKAFGVSGGLNFANQSFGMDGVRVSFDSRTAAQLSAFLRLPVSNQAFIQPEVTYIGRGLKLGDFFTDVNGQPLNFETELIINYLDIGATYQALLGQGPVKFLLGAGPAIGYAINGKSKGAVFVNGELQESEEDIDFEESGFNRLDLLLTAVAGLQFDLNNVSLFLTGRYQLGMLNISEAEEDVSVNNRGLGVQAGVVFPIGGN